ncbi:MAG: CCA tRNA nucleotidyltransferase [Oscillospiraceae bacterium]|nr:CCA tRNA nucleotidyltransferase [Oscillospiraceae bacterium]
MLGFSPPEHVEQILSHLAENGYAAYLVGGCARDSIMGRDVHDWDVATSAAPLDVARLFPKTALTGERFGTITVLAEGGSVEVTTFRVESGYSDNRRPDMVEFVDSLYADLSRRDFTINAMAISESRELIDPFGGANDIKARVIRCVGNPDERFSEDALRMFRALRFRAELGFDIEEETMRAIRSNADKAKFISAERVRIELEKTLMSQRPEIAGEMIAAGLLCCYMTKRVERLGGLERIRSFPSEPDMRWCAFCALLLKEYLISSAEEFLHSLRLDRKTIKTCAMALSVTKFPDSRTDIKRVLSKQDAQATRCAAAIHDGLDNMGDGLPSREHSKCLPYIKDNMTSPDSAGALTETEAITASGECYSISNLAVSGRDLIKLGYPPGRDLGHTLARLLDHVIERPEDNTRETLLKIASNMYMSIEKCVDNGYFIETDTKM